MLRNFIGFIAGVLLSYLLIFAVARLGWLLIVGTADTTDNKGEIVNIMVWNTLAIVPVSVVVGGVVALIVARAAWWVGGFAVLPLIIHGFIRTADRSGVVFDVASVGLAFAAAFLVSRWFRKRATNVPVNQSAAEVPQN